MKVGCRSCGVTVASSESNAFLVAFGAHTGEHPTPHEITVDAPDGEHTLLLRCLAPQCRSRPSEVVIKTTQALAAVHALAFHSYHEGHTLHIELDGATLHDGWKDREGCKSQNPEWNPPQ